MTASVPATLSPPVDGIVVLTLQDGEHRNTFTEAMVVALCDVLSRLNDLSDARVCILCGLEDVFCAGAPQELLQELAAGRLSPAEIVLSKALLDVPIPTIAAMEGHAVGGGLAFGLCCDLVLLAEESRYGCSFMNLGFTPGMGTTRLLQLAVGDYVANEMMLGGQMFKGSQLKLASQVNYVLPKAQVFAKAQTVARRIAEKPQAALRLLKAHLALPKRRAFEESRVVESFMHQVCFSDPETSRQIAENYTQSSRRASDAE